MARACLLLSDHFFRLLEGTVPTHYLDTDYEKGLMRCRKVQIIPIEWIARYEAWGSFCKTYGVERGRPLTLNATRGEPLLEVTVKDDQLGDPRINRDAAIVLGLITQCQYDHCFDHTLEVATTVAAEMKKHGFRLIDMKVEYGITAAGDVVLADEIGPSIWRVVDKDNNTVDAVTLAKAICPDHYKQAGCSCSGCGCDSRAALEEADKANPQQENK